MTAREAIHRLHERGWSNSQIAAAMGRGRGQIVNISSGRAKGESLRGALEALSRRKAPPPGVKPPPAGGAAKAPPKSSPGGRGTVADRLTVGKGKDKRRISKSLPVHNSARDIRRELLFYSKRRVRLSLVMDVNGISVTQTLFQRGINGRSLKKYIGDMDDLIDWLIERNYLRPDDEVSVTGWLIEEVR